MAREGPIYSLKTSELALKPGLMAGNKKNDRKEPSDIRSSDRTPRGGWSGSWASIRDLEILHRVIRVGGVTAAAKELGISQPAVSRTLALLEERSGLSFFTRQGTQVVPTTEALQLFDASESVFKALERVEALRWLEPEKEKISVVAAPTLAHCLLPRVIAEFRRKHPNISVTLDIQTTVEVISQVASDQVQLGFAEVPQGDWGVRTHAFRRSSLSVAVPKTHRWSGSKSIQAADIGDEPLIVLLKRNPFRTMLDRLLWREGGLPNIVLETSDVLSAIEHVGLGVGVAIVNPYPVMLQSSTDIRYVLLEPSLAYETSMLTNPSRVPTPGMRLLMECVLETQGAPSAFSVPT